MLASAAIRVKYGTYLGQIMDNTVKLRISQTVVPPALPCNQKHYNMKWQSISNNLSGPVREVWVAEIIQHHRVTIIGICLVNDRLLPCNNTC